LMPGTGGGEESLAVAWAQGDEEELWAAAMAAVEAACSGEAAQEAEAAAPAPVAPAAVLPQLPTPPPPLKGRVCIPCRCARGSAASVYCVCCVLLRSEGADCLGFPNTPTQTGWRASAAACKCHAIGTCVWGKMGAEH
jgi:hypothetical protein